MTEAAQNVATEAYVGTNEETRAVLSQVAEGVARVAEERVSWEVAVSEAERRQYSYAGRRSKTMDEGLLNQAMDARTRRMTPPAADPDAVFVEGVQFAERNVHVLTPSEYRRLQSEWMNYKYRGYQYTKRANGGIVVDFDNLIVYTDRRGQPEYVLDVRTDERWTNNDVYNLVVEMETEGITHEMQ